MPPVFKPEEVIQESGPVVAKLPGSNRGEDKYLLETLDQKVKFIAWALMYRTVSNLHKLPDNRAVLDRIFSKVSEGIFSDEFIQNRGWVDDWVFEKFIETPGPYATSFRVVVDAFGTLYYATVAHSEKPKKTVLMPKPTIDHPPLIEVDIPGRLFSVLLEHPDSPFYLAPKQFMSNVAQGGQRVSLDQRPVTNRVTAQILSDLNIDPSRPELPQPLQSLSQEIGKAYRRYTTHVGIDFMMDSCTQKFLLLEINKGPVLVPEALGLPAKTGQEQCEEYLLGQMIARLP